jgi:predicted DNA-binding transcriptional regulator YafY
VRAGRLVQLLLLLQVHGKLTARQLAERLEVSVRTVYRDLEALSGAGIPVLAEPGPQGGCRLVDGYRTRLTGLTPEEAEALALSGLPGPAADLGLGTVLAAAQVKVDAALPPELRRRASRVRERFHLDAPGWFSRTEDVPHLSLLAQAVWEERRADITYARSDRPVERTVDPLGLVLKAGRWYLVAGAGRSREPRTYRVSRVQAAELRDDPVQRPDGFDLADHWARSADDFAHSMLRHEVRARVRVSHLRELRLFLEPAAAERALASVGPPDADGWADVVVPAESLDYALHDLLRMGPHVEVLAPEELRRKLAETGRAMAALYASGGDDHATGAAAAGGRDGGDRGDGGDGDPGDAGDGGKPARPRRLQASVG